MPSSSDAVAASPSPSAGCHDGRERSARPVEIAFPDLLRQITPFRDSCRGDGTSLCPATARCGPRLVARLINTPAFGRRCIPAPPHGAQSAPWGPRLAALRRRIYETDHLVLRDRHGRLFVLEPMVFL